MLKQMSLAVLVAATIAPLGGAQQVRVRVTAENLSPTQATYVTPIWAAFHDGSFDVFDVTVAASSELESLAEDGDSTALAAAFVVAATGQANANLGTAPIAPGSSVSGNFLVDPTLTTARFFSYAAMVLPSNDAFVGNDDPVSIPIFDGGGNFVAANLFVIGAEIFDAGTEVNDELPANTAFFGQEVANTGTAEGGVVAAHAGFNAKGTGGILDDSSYSEGDFTETGYPVLKLRFAAADAIVDAREHTVSLDGDQESTPVNTKAKGSGSFDLQIGGNSISYDVKFPKKKLKNVTGAHLHMGAMGMDGPIVASLFAPESSQKKVKKLTGTITADDLTGPFAGMPLDALAAEIEAGNIYMNVHTTKNPTGEIRGQLMLVVVP